eukprot:gnl/Trimastix_PCT/689.p1 GENE.gnl/Trimastix_PCT/689~~gnl/Trimastix_PCT/689.p1  ORF type:complete len:670 (-),score=136.95 gnl/Trimastix_PCT/689:30-2039(-)
MQSPPLSFVIRHRGGTELYQGPPDPSKDERFFSSSANGPMCFSDNGQYFAIVNKDEDGYTLHDMASGSVMREVLGEPSTKEIAFSPNGEYLVSWKLLARGQSEPNLAIWHVASGEKLYHFVLRETPYWPVIEWCDNTCFAFVRTNHYIEIYDLENAAQQREGAQGPITPRYTHRHHCQRVTRFAFSKDPTGRTHMATFAPAKGDLPAQLAIVTYPELAQVALKSFYRCDSADLHWSAKGRVVLCSARNATDVTNRSYYGETSLHLLSLQGDMPNLPVESPVHDVKWNRAGTQFLVLHGPMPARATMFTAAGALVRDLAVRGSRNTISWSPRNRYFLMGGFGNLANGEIEIWDAEGMHCVGYATYPWACCISWSPDSSYIAAAVVSPRLRVDNGIKIFRLNGEEVWSLQPEALYDLVWRPAPSTSFPAPTPPPALASVTKVADAPKQAAYRPRGVSEATAALFKKKLSLRSSENAARSTERRPSQSSATGPSWRDPKPRLPPGASFVEQPAPTSQAEKNRRKKRRAKKQGEDATAPEVAEEQRPRVSRKQPAAPPTFEFAEPLIVPTSTSTSTTTTARAPAQQRSSKPKSRRPAASAAQEPSAAPSPYANQDPVRRLKILRKKFSQIEQLEKRADEGAELDEAQLCKVRTKSAIAQQITELEDLAASASE